MSESFDSEKERASSLEQVFLKILLFVFICAIGGIVVAWISQIKFQEKKESILTPIARESPTPTPPSIPSFQQLLTTLCIKDTSSPNAYLSSIKTLPFAFNTAVIKLSSQDQHALLCMGDEETKYLVLTTIDNNTIYIYDSHSQETSTKNYSRFQPLLFSKTIVDDNSKTIAFFMENRPNSTIGISSLLLRGTKKIVLPNKENIFVTTDTLGIPGNDTRLVKLLSLFSEAKNSNLLDITKEPTYLNVLQKTFFSNIFSLARPEQNNLTSLQATLDAFSAK